MRFSKFREEPHHPLAQWWECPECEYMATWEYLKGYSDGVAALTRDISKVLEERR